METLVLENYYEIVVLENYYKIVVPLFGAAYDLYWFRSLSDSAKSYRK